jgi:hypothetical protein
MSSTPPAQGPVVRGARLEASPHGVIVDAEVEDLREVGQELVAVAAAAAHEQHVLLAAFELADGLLPVPHPCVEPDGPPGRPVSGSALKDQTRSVLSAAKPRRTSSSYTADLPAPDKPSTR